MDHVYLLNLQTILMSDHCMVSPDVILETSHIFIAIIQLLFSTRIRRVDFKCLIFPETRHVSGEEKNRAFFSKTSKQASNLCF